MSRFFWCRSIIHLQKKAMNMQTDANMEGVKSYALSFFSKGKKNVFLLWKLFLLSASFDSIFFQGRLYWQKKQETDPEVLESEEPIASPQTFLQFLLKKRYLKSTNLKLQKWPKYLAFPCPYVQSSGHDLCELGNYEQKINFQDFLNRGGGKNRRSLKVVVEK